MKLAMLAFLYCWEFVKNSFAVPCYKFFGESMRNILYYYIFQMTVNVDQMCISGTGANKDDIAFPEQNPILEVKLLMFLKPKNSIYIVAVLSQPKCHLGFLEFHRSQKIEQILPVAITQWINFHSKEKELY